MPESATFEAIQTQELDDDSLLKDTLSVTVKGDEKLLDAEYIAVKSYTGNAQTFDMYRIITDTTPNKTMSFTGMSLAPYELNGYIIQDLRPTNHTLEYTLNRILNGTDWRLGYIDSNLSNVTTTFYYVSAKEALKELQSLVGCEFVFKVEISGQKITDKWIEVYKEMGNRTKKRFNYGTNALTVVRETNKTEIYTALIGRGKGEEVSSGEDNESGQAGYGRKITFEDIEWSTAKGDPLDKPKGQYYLELPQATQAYGIKNIDGTISARIGIVDFDDEEDKNRLINLTYQQLLVSSRPKVLFKTTVANIGATGIGDTVTIHRHDLNIHYQTRVRKIVRNKLNDNKTQVELGDAVVTASTKRDKQNNATIKNLNQEIEKVKADVTISQTSADGKNTIFYGSAEPERQRTGDTWYRPHPSIAGETQMLVWNGTAWELVIDTSDLASVSSEVKNVADKADNAVQAAQDADIKANDALEKVGVNTDLISEHNNIIASLNGQLSDDLVTDQTVLSPKKWLTNYGKLVANNGYDTTDYLPVGEGDSLSLESTVSHYYKLAFYDNAKNNIGYYDGSEVVLTPSGTAYFGNTGTFNSPADGFVRLSYSTATGGANTVKLSNQSNLYTLINSGYNNALSALANANRAMQEFGENLISYDGLSRGYWLNAQGKLMEKAGYKTTDYIRVDSGERYKLTGGNAVYQVYFYGADRNAIAYYDGKGIKTDIGTGLKYFTAIPNIELIMPSNASYVRIASSIADFEQVSFSKLSTIIANMFNAVDSMKQSVENDLSAVRDKANEAFDKANVNGGKLTTVEQSVDDLKGEISQKVTSADVSTALNTFNETVKTQTASQITESLTGYAKSTDLNGLATEYYARTQATTEAGKVRQELTSYAKTGDLTTLAQNIRTETAESLKSVYTKTETNGLLGDKISKATYESGIDGVEQSITSVRGDLDKLSVGGRNLILNSEKEVANNAYLLASYKLSDVSLIESGKDYVITIVGELSEGQTGWYLNLYRNVNGSLDYPVMVSLDESNKIYKNTWSKTFKMPVDNNLTGTMALYSFPLGNGKVSKVSKIKLSRGNVISADSSQALEDMLGQADFQAFKNTYESNDKLIKSRLLAIDSTDEGSLATRLNATEKTASGNTTTISNIKTSPEEHITGYQMIKERSDLYERVIGSSSEAGVKSNMARIVMADNIFKTEVIDKTNVDESNTFSSKTNMSVLANIGSITRDESLAPNGFRVTGAQGNNGSFRLHKVITSNGWWTVSGWVRGSQNADIEFTIDICYVPSDKRFNTGTKNEWQYFEFSHNVTNATSSRDFVDFKGIEWMYYYFKDIKVEKNHHATAWTPSAIDFATQSHITQLSDNINLKVSKSDLISQINVQAGGVLITSGTNKLNVTPETTYIENGTIKSAMIESLEASKIKTGTLDAGKVKVINIDAENITSNKTSFVQSAWNEATGGGVTITGAGVRAINSEGSRVTLENGVVSVGNRAGVNLGFFGDHVLNKSATGTMTITASHGTETAFISATSTDGKTYKRSMSIMAGAGEIDMFTILDMNKNSLKDVTDIGFTGGHIKGTISDSGARYMTIDAGTGTAFDIAGVTRMSITSVVNIFSGIDMRGKDIASVGKLTYNSDQRLKTNIKDTNIRALDAIRNWQLVSYDWLESGEHVEIGLIAQNSPEVMTYNEETDIYGIDAGKQTMINTLAIQQLDSKTNDEISQLKAQVASLQDELALLKGA